MRLATKSLLAGMMCGTTLIFGCKGSEKAELKDAIPSNPAPIETASPDLFDTNDVSVLFSYDLNADNIRPDLPMSQFMSKDLFDQLMKASAATTLVPETGHSGVGADIYENWKIISFRFDPCAPSAALANGEVPTEMAALIPGCLVQLRLIAQPLALAGRGVLDNPDNPAMYDKKVPRDFIAHIIFNLGVLKGDKDTKILQQNFEKFLPLVNDLRKIKLASEKLGVDTNGTLMDVHPGLLAERAQGKDDVSKEIVSFLGTYLKQDAMQLIAFMGIHGSVGPWRFFNGVVSKQGNEPAVFTLSKLQDFKDPDKTSQTAPNQDPRGGGNYLDGPERPLSIRKLFDKKYDIAAVEGAFDIQNPITTHALNMDCTSCHSVQFPMFGSRLGFQGIRNLEELPQNRFKIPRGISAYTKARSRSNWNLHNFAYFVDKPTVSPRTVTETAAVVQLSNRLIAGDQALNPGLDCGDDPKLLDEIFRCDLGENCTKACKVVGKKPVE